MLEKVAEKDFHMFSLLFYSVAPHLFTWKKEEENKLFFPMLAENCSLGRGWNSFFRSSRKGKLTEHKILDIALTCLKGMFGWRCIKPFLLCFFFFSFSFFTENLFRPHPSEMVFYTIIGKLFHFLGFS